MIYGERIRLRAIERTDLAQFVDWLNDPEVRQGLMINLPLSLAEEQTWYENMLKRPQVEHPLVIEIMTDDGWERIGNCGLMDFDWQVRQAEFGIFIGAKQFWNQGYGTEAFKTMIHHGFDTLNLNRISLRVYENNPRAIRSYLSVGFVEEGIMREAVFQDGEYVDVAFMSILYSEWQERRSR